MKTIIAGSRGFNDPALLAWVMGSVPWQVTQVVVGRARGTDEIGEAWAIANGIPVMAMPVTPAMWDAQGKSAGPRRNERMAMWAGAAVIFWDGQSAGTRNMIELATARRLLLVTHIYPNAARGHFPTAAAHRIDP